MKIEEYTPVVERSDEFNTQHFGISNMAFVLEILRSKLYSDPIKAICQEIPSNARDAHREVGTPDRPVEITLPTKFNPYYSVRDYGPSITPDRMTNIFLQYGSSTKRDSNEQTGGLGIGAKTPFSYTDNFSVESITTENGENIKRTYVAYIGEDRIGNLDLVEEAKTDEEQGTRITIGIKSSDYQRFIDATRDILRHWSPRPEIKGGATISWPITDTPLFETKDKTFRMFKRTSSYYSNMDTTIILDGIPYPLNVEKILQDDSEERGLLRWKDVYLYFNTGDMSVSANRESIELNGDAVAKIKNKLTMALGELKEDVHKKIKDATTELEVRKILSGVLGSYDLHTLKTVNWRGRTINYDNFGIRINVYKKLESWTFSFDEDYPSVRKNHGSISNDTDLVLIVDDLDECQTFSRSRAKTAALHHFPNKTYGKKIVVLRFNDPKEQLSFENDHPLSDLPAYMLSQYEKYQKVNKGGGTKKRGQHHIIHAIGRNNNQGLVADVRTLSGVYFNTMRNKVEAHLNSGWNLIDMWDIFNSLGITNDEDVYLIPPRHTNMALKNDDLISIGDYITEQIKEFLTNNKLSADQWSTLLKDDSNVDTIRHMCYSSKTVAKIVNELNQLDKNSKFRQWVEASRSNPETVKTESGTSVDLGKYRRVLNAAKKCEIDYKTFVPQGTKEISIAKLKDECKVKYPLLFDNYNRLTVDEPSQVKHAFDYITCVDSGKISN